MSKYESNVKVIPYSEERVYEKLSDLNNLKEFKDSLPHEKVKNMSFDADTLYINAAPVGQLTLKIVEREPYNSIKFEAVNSPIPFKLWILITSTAAEECEIKTAVDVDVNPFMKAMIQKPLQEGLEKMVEMLSLINY